jgi:methylmalonyl-CoA mutase C-terminal domain/subunit
MHGRAQPIRVLLSKIGLDTHDRGIKLVAAWLRDAGMEVIYLGPYKTVEEVSSVAVQEDVAVIGTSFLDGGHVGWITDLLAELDRADAGDIPVIVGGIVPAPDEAELLGLGVDAVLHPGTPMSDVVAAFEEAAATRSGLSRSTQPSDPARPRGESKQ